MRFIWDSTVLYTVYPDLYEIHMRQYVHCTLCIRLAMWSNISRSSFLERDKLSSLPSCSWCPSYSSEGKAACSKLGHQLQLGREDSFCPLGAALLPEGGWLAKATRPCAGVSTTSALGTACSKRRGAEKGRRCLKLWLQK